MGKQFSVSKLCNEFIMQQFQKMIAYNLLMSNRMRNQWLNDNLVIYVENDIFNKTNNELFIQLF